MARAGGALTTNEARLAAVRAACAAVIARPSEAARQAVRAADRTGVPLDLVTALLVEAAERAAPAARP
ncbi:hypothetical protein [Actinomadura roseirufa]|uniref:hypothetical protein n=1 Tax=Actinomadura roseirufa TaxID=2094049 RepID=UPI001041A287|nr:hypothetical protein [Actinomadura roseirufa]